VNRAKEGIELSWHGAASILYNHLQKDSFGIGSVLKSQKNLGAQMYK
jgi:hypothetical protein